MFSNTLANWILNEVFRGGYDSTLWLALHRADPTVLSDLSTEVFGGGYEREQVDFDPASGRMIANSGTVEFEVPSTTITHMAVWESKTFGSMLAYGALATPRTVSNSDTFVVAPGEFVVSL